MHHLELKPKTYKLHFLTSGWCVDPELDRLHGQSAKNYMWNGIDDDVVIVSKNTI